MSLKQSPYKLAFVTALLAGIFSSIGGYFLSNIQAEHVMKAKQFEYSFIDTETTGISSTLYMAFNKNFSEKEKIKGLRSQININWLMHGNKSVLIAGTDGDDSVAVLSANLAIAFSQSGKRTLLVDANMRDSTLHNYFSIKNKQGLSDVLAERSSIHDALHTVKPLANLYFLPSGTQVLNQGESVNKLLNQSQLS